MGSSGLYDQNIYIIYSINFSNIVDANTYSYSLGSFNIQNVYVATSTGNNLPILNNYLNSDPVIRNPYTSYTDTVNPTLNTNGNQNTCGFDENNSSINQELLYFIESSPLPLPILVEIGLHSLVDKRW